MVDAVRYSGGWLFDSAMAGWDVLVLAADCDDDRPLQILGAHAGDLDSAMTSRLRGPRPHSLAVDTELFETDGRVRHLVLMSLENGLTEVRLFGQDWPVDTDDEAASMCHRLSVAARAFKAHALAVALAPGETVEAPDTTEVFHCGDMLSVYSDSPGLQPV